MKITLNLGTILDTLFDNFIIIWVSQGEELGASMFTALHILAPLEAIYNIQESLVQDKNAVLILSARKV